MAFVGSPTMRPAMSSRARLGAPGRSLGKCGAGFPHVANGSSPDKPFSTFPQRPASQKGRRTIEKIFPALAAFVVRTAPVTPAVGQPPHAHLIRVSYPDLNHLQSLWH